MNLVLVGFCVVEFYRMQGAEKIERPKNYAAALEYLRKKREES
jgi:hypothetical protein